MKNLYYVINVGFYDQTKGLVEIEDIDFPKFKNFIENLNKNSTYACIMPTIEVYKVNWDLLREVLYDDDERYEWLYFEDKVYVFKENVWTIMDELERIV